MYMDKELTFSDAQAVTASAASTNYLDLSAIRNVGVGENLYLVVQVDVTLDDSGDDSTIAVTLQTDDNTSFSSATTGMTIGTFAANAAAGSRFVVRLQPDKINERYARVYYTAANGDLSAGSFTAFITPVVDAYTAYADNVAIA